MSSDKEPVFTAFRIQFVGFGQENFNRFVTFGFGCKNIWNRFRLVTFGFDGGFRFRLQKDFESVSSCNFRFRLRFPNRNRKPIDTGSLSELNH